MNGRGDAWCPVGGTTRTPRPTGDARDSETADRSGYGDTAAGRGLGARHVLHRAKLLPVLAALAPVGPCSSPPRLGRGWPEGPPGCFVTTRESSIWRQRWTLP